MATTKPVTGMLGSLAAIPHKKVSAYYKDNNILIFYACNVSPNRLYSLIHKPYTHLPLFCGWTGVDFVRVALNLAPTEPMGFFKTTRGVTLAGTFRVTGRSSGETVAINFGVTLGVLGVFGVSSFCLGLGAPS